ncbi:MAG: hypothetical protein ACKVJC_06345 [Flavobacteriales bacterium]
MFAQVQDIIVKKDVSKNETSAPDKKDSIHENGLFIEGMFGYPTNNYNTVTTTTSSETPGEASILMRLGSK